MSKATLLVTFGLCVSCSHTSPPPVRAPAEQTSVASSSASQSGSVFIGCGFLIAENHGATNFMVFLAAEHARSVRHENATAYILDNVLVEVTSTTAREMGARDVRGPALLRKYLEWETKYLETKPGWTDLASPEIGNIDLGVSEPTLAWIVKPTGNAEVMGQRIAGLLYVTAAIDDVVFVLAAPMRGTSELRAVGPALQRILKTLRRQSGPTDIYALSSEIKNSSQPWSGCPKR